MSLKSEAIDKLFARLMASYGRDFLARYEGQDPLAVKATWARELSGYSTTLASIAWALDNLPDKAPNVFEFRALCRRAPMQNAGLLPPPAQNPETVARELLRLAALRDKTAKQPVDRLDWARKLKARDEANKNAVTQVERRMYREALRHELTSEAA